jgi:predicted nucleic acid-binding protein
VNAVLDASATVELLLDSAAAADVREAIEAASGQVHAPDHMPTEVLSAVRRLASRGIVAEARALGALEDLTALPMEYWPALPLIGRAWQLRGDITPFDATYVALAEILGAVLITVDRPLARAVAKVSTVRVALVG